MMIRSDYDAGCIFFITNLEILIQENSYFNGAGKEAEGKPMEQLFPLIMSTNKKLQDQNLTFTKDENEMMIDILTRNMTGKQKKQFEMIKAMMLNLNR